MTHQSPPNQGRAKAWAETTTEVPTRLGRLHVRSIGEGAPTILWSSMFVDSHTWDPLLPLLPSGRRYHLVDPPGLGASEPLRASSDITAAADAAADLIRELGIRSPLDWVGNAFGGHVGLKLGARPGILRSLVAISSPTQPIPDALRTQINILLPILRTAGPIGPVRSAILTAMLTDASTDCDPIHRAVTQSLQRPTRRSMALAVRSFILNRVDVTAELTDLTVPSLFIASDDRGDWTPEDARAAAALAPHAQAITIPEARTLIPLEQPEGVALHVRNFWDRLAPTRSHQPQET